MIRSGKYEFLLQASTATNSARLAMYFILLFIYRSLHCICNFYEKQTVQSDATCTSSLTLCLWYQRLLISDMDRYLGQKHHTRVVVLQ